MGLPGGGRGFRRVILLKTPTAGTALDRLWLCLGSALLSQRSGGH